jgi:hypothetical protein
MKKRYTYLFILVFSTADTSLVILNLMNSIRQPNGAKFQEGNLLLWRLRSRETKEQPFKTRDKPVVGSSGRSNLGAQFAA